ncbi:MAG: NAD(P)H-quinone oxidoreductase [Candidatus Eremiobacteraeota bacterium]|nr:NAD(P)H-quinone oxidoreductase [Candidatus Eremiobacteraeota bacterium]
MRHVTFDRPGGPEVLRIAQAQPPQPGPNEALIAVAAIGVSRADSMQRRGSYPPPPGASPILGLEVAGTIAALGRRVSGWKVGDGVCALTNGGGYAEEVVVPQGQMLPVPSGWSMIEAATLPENAFTVYDNLFTRARLRAGETVLVHGGSSGIGTTAIMFATALGATAIATAGTPEKCAACLKLGAAHAIDYRAGDFVADVARITGGRGVDVVLDIVGGDYLARDLASLALDGRIACIAAPRGRVVEIDLGPLFARRGTILASTLRPRTAREKAVIARALRRRIWPLLPQRDAIVPVVDSVYPLERAADAHARLEAGAHIGKLVLVIDRLTDRRRAGRHEEQHRNGKQRIGS